MSSSRCSSPWWLLSRLSLSGSPARPLPELYGGYAEEEDDEEASLLMLLPSSRVDEDIELDRPGARAGCCC